MARFSTKFLRFLEVNNPAAFKLIPKGEDVPDDLYNQLIAANDTRYKLWLSLPQWVRDRCHDRIPDEIASGRMSVEAYVKKQEEEVKQEQKDIQEAVSVGVGALAIGYAAETAATLAEDRALRESLSALAIEGLLTPEQRAQWLESRFKDMEAIRKEWEASHPEKYLLHLAKAISRAKRHYGRAQTPEERISSAEKIKELKDKFKQYAANLGATNLEAKHHILNYLSRQPQQAALRHLDRDSLGLFTSAMRSQGIKIEPTIRDKTGAILTLGKDSLTQALKNQFERKLNEESILKTMAEKAKRDFTRITARQFARSRRPSLAPILKIRRERTVQMA